MSTVRARFAKHNCRAPVCRDLILCLFHTREHEVVVLKPGGVDIPVTQTNCIEYIHLVAHYKLNVQLQQQFAAFREGLSRVVPLAWLRLFSQAELQVLISGAEVPIDVHDLRQNTTYSGKLCQRELWVWEGGGAGTHGKVDCICDFLLSYRRVHCRARVYTDVLECDRGVLRARTLSPPQVCHKLQPSTLAGLQRALSSFLCDVRGERAAAAECLHMHEPS